MSREHIGKIERGKANPTLPAVQNNSGTLSITWTKAPGHLGTCGTDFVIETSDTLTGVWTTELLGVNVTANCGSFTYTFPPGNRRLVRLKVMLP